MKIEQFEDKSLAHYAYAILSEQTAEVVLIDPARDPQPYYDYALRHGARIVGVIETHPHADFVSSHLEIHESTGAPVYVSKLVGVSYPHITFDTGDTIRLGEVTLRALNTPGHSPDSICIVAEQEGRDAAIFTGDTLFIGDCGRPDLREKVGSIVATREALARQMYHSLRTATIAGLPDDCLVYPAHGAGSLCGKGLGEANSSTIGVERMSNWSLQPMDEEVFIKKLLADQPFIPRYFGYDVGVNRVGAENVAYSLSRVPVVATPVSGSALDAGTLVIDTRGQQAFMQGHLPHSINLMNGGKFETWLGSIINPGEMFYLAAESEVVLRELIRRTARIGYEKFIKLAFVLTGGPVTGKALDTSSFHDDTAAYTVVDVRNASEAAEHPLFTGSLNIPLPELRDRLAEIPNTKPVVVHCAGGYRSAAGSSLIALALNGTTPVYDLGEAVRTF